MTPQRTGSAEWRAHWPMVLAGMIGLSFYSVITYSLGTFIAPLEEEFGWSRAEISAGLTIFAGISMLGGPLIGAAVDRFGTRRIAVGGMALSALAFAGFSLANGSVLQWLALFAIYGLFALAIRSTIWSTGVSSVFTASRSLALAVMLSGTAIAQTFAPLVSEWLIANWGWRSAYAWIGLGWGGLAFLLVALFFLDARELGKRTATTQPQASAMPGLTLRQALRDHRVIRIALANLIMSLVGAGVTVHLVPIVSEAGLDRTTAVQIVATAGVAGLAGKLGVGALLDRVQGSIIPFLGYAVAGLGHFLLLDTFNSSAALTVGVMALGFASGAGLQVSTYLVSRYAGLRNFATIFGVISSMMMAGAAMGPMIAGYVHDVAGSYAPLLMTAAPVMVICAFFFVGLGPYPDFGATSADEEPQSPPKT